jgi:AraC-like DNA-binding protein
VFAGSGVSPDLFDDPDNRVSFRERAHLIRICAEYTRCPEFGLLVGRRVGLSSLGLIGYLVRNSPDVESALRSLVHHFHLHAEGSLALLEVGDDFAFLGYGIYQDRVEAARLVVEAAVAIIVNDMRQLCGSEWFPSEVVFAHSEPADLKPYKRFFKAPLRFNAEQSGVYFSSKWLKYPVIGADPELHRLLEKQVKALEQQYRNDFPEQVRRVVSVALLANQATSDHIAALFSIHSRTLHRRLKSRGTSFREIVDECRFNLAQQLLQDADMDHAQIADMLGYSGARAFSRAFRRWSGITPSRWKQLGQQ